VFPGSGEDLFMKVCGVMPCSRADPNKIFMVAASQDLSLVRGYFSMYEKQKLQPATPPAAVEVDSMTSQTV